MIPSFGSLSDHLPVLPLLVPLAAGALLLVGHRRLDGGRASVLGLASTALQLLLAMLILARVADGTVLPYLAGNWPVPFGIGLAVDRLGALLLLLTAVTGLCGLVASLCSPGEARARFHALFQFQLLGLNGAFLTADLFNLFVFFEVLLIASYGLLVHGGEGRRVRAGIHYAAVNLAGSALLLLAVSLLYGVAGTLNMADLARVLPGLPDADQGLVRAAGLLLLVVFGLKAALLPLYGWLPGTYSVAIPAVAALFAILTKVGVYAIARVHTLVFGGDGSSAAWLDPGPVLVPLGLATVVAASLGVLASRDLGRQVSYLVVASAGTLLATLGLGTPAALAAAFFYLAHTSLTAAAFFLVAALVRRPDDGATEGPTGSPARPALAGSLFLVAAMAATGLPPLAGFVAKALLLTAGYATSWRTAFTATLLVAGLITIVALARTGSRLFWKPEGGTQAPHSTPLALGASLLLALAAALTVGAGPVWDYSRELAADLLARQPYMDAVLHAPPAPRLDLEVIP
jgi:multicomponent K+:H+ antiporter subunit D